MQVRVKLFASYREIVGVRQLTWSTRDGATLGEVVNSMIAMYPGLAGHRDSMLLAVNLSFAVPEALLQEGDEIALMPPVSGGLS